MNRLEQLIKNLCPNGVEYKKLGDIATDVFRGAGITRDQVTEEGTPCVRYGEIYTTYGIYFDTCVSHTDEDSIQSKKYFEYGDILFAITGESVEDIAKSTAYVGHEKCLAGGDIVVLKHNQNPKYLSYVLSTTSAQMQKRKGKVKSKVVHSSVPSIKDIVIPVPPIEVQSEIVKILDNFTELTAELTSELTARKKQYEYYRDMLLDFGVHGEATNDCEWRMLEEIAEIKGRIGFRGYKRDDIVEDNGAITLSPTNIESTRINWSNCTLLSWDKYYESPDIMVQNDDIIFTTRASIGKIGIVKKMPKETTINPQAVIIRVKNNYNADYLNYLLHTTKLSKEIKKITGSGTIPLITQKDLGKLKVCLPPIKEQERIVSILDRFDKLCNDISEGLPAEIEARRKQYEYYRDKLLSFEEVKA